MTEPSPLQVKSSLTKSCRPAGPGAGALPVAGAAVNVWGHSKAGNYVDLRAERGVLAALSNCPQMHNPCNAYNLTPIRAIVWRPTRSDKPDGAKST